VTNIPIFPLNAVLFPQGVLPLRVFEPRYMDMVRDCMKQETGFGVCMLKSGSEVGGVATPEEIGCLAHITDWDMQEVGVLNIRTLGSQRFRIRSHQIAPDKLLRADVVWIADDASIPVEPVYAGCVLLLRRIINENQEKGGPMPIAEPFLFEDTAWISNRLCEFLPISTRAKQKLMELEDAPTRLSLVYQFLKQHKVL
jgi:Lon protease-like protein